MHPRICTWYVCVHRHRRLHAAACAAQVGTSAVRSAPFATLGGLVIGAGAVPASPTRSAAAAGTPAAAAAAAGSVRAVRVYDRVLQLRELRVRLRSSSAARIGRRERSGVGRTVARFRRAAGARGGRDRQASRGRVQYKRRIVYYRGPLPPRLPAP